MKYLSTITSILILMFLPLSAQAFPGSEALSVTSSLIGALFAHVSSMLSILVKEGSGRVSGLIKSGSWFLVVLFVITLSFVAIHKSSNEDYQALVKTNFQKTVPDQRPQLMNADDSYYESLSADMQNQLLKREFDPSDSDLSVDDFTIVPALAFNMVSENFGQGARDRSHYAVVNSDKFTFVNLENREKPILLIDRTGFISKKGVEVLLSSNKKESPVFYLKGGYKSLLGEETGSKDSVETIDANGFKEMLGKKHMIVDIDPFYSFRDLGHYYTATSMSFLEVVSKEGSFDKIKNFEGDVLFLRFSYDESLEMARWASEAMGRNIKVFEGGSKSFEESGVNWIPEYKNKNRIILPEDVFDWVYYNDLVFLDFRKFEDYKNSSENWVSKFFPAMDYKTLDELRKKIRNTFPKDRRYVGLAYSQADSFNAVLIGYLMHEEGYQWLGLLPTPNILSYSLINEREEYRPPLTKDFHQTINSYVSDMDSPVWLILLCYGVFVRLLLVPLSGLSSTPSFFRKPLSSRITIPSGLTFIGLLVLCAYHLQVWAIDYGFVNHSKSLFGTDLYLSGNIEYWVVLGLIFIQMFLSRSQIAKRRSLSFGLIGGIVVLVAVLIRDMPNYLYYYMAGVTITSIVLQVITSIYEGLKTPTSHGEFGETFNRRLKGSVLGLKDLSEKEHGVKAGRQAVLWQKGVLVPNAFLLTSVFFKEELFLDQKVLEALSKLLKKSKGIWIIRSAAKTEDDNAASVGAYQSVFFNCEESHQNLGKKLLLVWSSQSGVPHSDRQIFVQERVEADEYGVILSRDYENPSKILIEKGEHASVTEGGVVKSQKIDREEKSQKHSTFVAWANRFEEYFGEAVDVEFAIKGKKTYLLQCRKIQGFEFVHPEVSESIKLDAVRKKSKKFKEHLFDDYCPSPDPLSLSIIHEIYGDKFMSVYGRPAIKPGIFVPLPKSIFEEVTEKFTTDSRLFYETIISMSMDKVSSTSKSMLLERCVDLLKQALRISGTLKSRFNAKTFKNMDGDKLENMLKLEFLKQNALDFMVPEVFSIKQQTKSHNGGFSFDSKSPHITLLTAVHYHEATIYEGLRILVKELSEALLGNASTDLIVGATYKELRGLDSSKKEDWGKRIDQQQRLLETRSGESHHQKVTRSNTVKCVEGIIVKPDPSKGIDRSQAQGGILVMENGRSDLIGVLDEVNAVITRNGGQASHWFMVAQYKNVPAISGDKTINLEDWEDGTKVCLV